MSTRHDRSAPPCVGTATSESAGPRTLGELRATLHQDVAPNLSALGFVLATLSSRLHGQEDESLCVQAQCLAEELAQSVRRLHAQLHAPVPASPAMAALREMASAVERQQNTPVRVAVAGDLDALDGPSLTHLLGIARYALHGLALGAGDAELSIDLDVRTGISIDARRRGPGRHIPDGMLAMIELHVRGLGAEWSRSHDATGEELRCLRRPG